MTYALPVVAIVLAVTSIWLSARVIKRCKRTIAEGEQRLRELDN